MSNVLILNYHEIVEDYEGDAGNFENRFAVKKSNFIRHLDLIEQKGIPIVSASDWLNNNVRDDFVVVLTFDDGFKSDYDIVFPILEKRGIKVSFFPILSYVEKENRLSWNQLSEIASYGCGIGSHGVFHQNMRRVGKEACKLELELSKRIMESQLNINIDTFAAPYGLYNRRLLQLAFNAGYHKVFSTQVKINQSCDSLVLHRWNLKYNTSISTLDKMLTKGSSMYYKQSLLSKVKNQFSKSFGVRYISKLNTMMLK